MRWNLIMKNDGEIRLGQKTKRIDESKPLVTIVTVVYNCEKEIEETIQSVLNQTYNNIEYIIIDGASNDNTIEIVKKYDDNIDYWVSEKDNGIYDAMNKAIYRASGEWINFMNAGDSFASHDVLEKIFSKQHFKEYDFIYGQHIWKNENEERVIPTNSLNVMWQKISFCHQSLFSRTKLMKEKPFDLTYKIVCDYENYFSRYMEGKKFYAVDFPIAVFLAGGFSDIHFFKRTKERYSVVKKHKNDFEMKNFYLNLVLKHYFRKMIKKMLK